MEGTSTETRNSCAMIHPALLPFVRECLLNDALNTQGGVLEIKRPRTRLGAAYSDPPPSCDHTYVHLQFVDI